MSTGTTKPFAGFEWMIAWRYIKAKRREGGVSVMTWISLIGIALAVFALIATLAVRSGFRTEFTNTILGANAHASIYVSPYVDPQGVTVRSFSDYEAKVAEIKKVPGVVRVAPIVNAQVMASGNGRNAGVQVFGETLDDLKTLPLIAEPETRIGSIEDFENGIAIGTGVARELGLTVGDKITLISPDGVKTAFGTSPRVGSYDIVYIFGVGRYDIDKVRVYMPLAEAQAFFNREGVVDEFEVMVADPDRVDEMTGELTRAAGDRSLAWTWKNASGAFLRALQMEDNIMFVILSILVLIASMNIVSGLIMLVKNKGRDVGILRTMGLTEGSVMRVFFICGASIGVVGTIVGVIMGCLFALYIDPIFDLVNYIGGGGVWDPSVRLLSNLPAKLELGDVLSAVVLSLGLSFTITIFPARRAARMNPVEALRYE
ncbi:lipoprotein-releasing ABC transporter permease subunit [Amylibacter sp. SFDW26]|uniref:lipoprotein-releasing ABC transporter permease subunit n=1 Tax=Amylibacter sp. SFDW26 TaxID=2652722 RepID=UPI00126142AE|nr:lipoprotein-releasing ABC transporter permease subunit [Amylibacter sp. SFDW26]KAB7613672.1 lipoprotein-releasing ABC transporter permease subunit [Amylibacter sp. SFDW26]